MSIVENLAISLQIAGSQVEKHLVNIVVNLTIKVRNVELLRISGKKKFFLHFLFM